jgi:hypothetical protein
MKLVTVWTIVLTAGLLSACGKKEEAPLPLTPPASANASNPTAVAAASNPLFEKLKGKWLRPDGGYVLEILSVESSGKIEAEYSNPRPIHVSKAEASQDGGATKVFVELRDVNYPGCTYTLTYDPGSDQLAGIYYQAAIQQQFEVSFERMK